MQNSGNVRTTAVDASGNLYVSGSFTNIWGTSANNIAKWNGSSWSPLGSGLSGAVYALAVLDQDLYAGGIFTTAGGNPATNIAKWNGSGWSALGTGATEPSGNSYAGVYALAPSGGEMYVGGLFTLAGGKASTYLAKATVIDRPVAIVTTNAIGFSNGVFGFHLSGPAGYNVEVQASTNLQVWTPVGTHLLGAGLCSSSDPQSSINSRRFYRARLLP